MLRNLLRWARTTKPGDNGKQFPDHQVEYLGKVADSARLFPYGFYANIPDDVLSLIASVQDNPDNRVTLGCLLKNYPDSDGTELFFYHPLIPNLKIKLCSDGKMLIQSDVKIDIVAPETEFTGIVKANGKVIDDTHGHTQGNDSAGNAQEPISGVTS